MQERRNLTRRHQLNNLRRRRLRIELLEDRRLMASLTVNSLLDNTSPGDGLVTIREAIIAADTDATTDLGHTGSGADTIAFAASLTSGGPATILLTQGELQISAALTIEGPGPDLLTLDAQHASRILNITASTGAFVVRGLTLTHGRTTGDNGTVSINTFSGGAIRSVTTGSLTIDQCNVIGNSTTGERARGGGIFAERSLTITHSHVSGNSTAGTDARGGGIRIQIGGLTLANSTVSGNNTTGPGSPGGGISGDTTMTLTHSTVSGNSTSGSNAHGGGIYNRYNVTLTSSTITGNGATGAGAIGGGIWLSVFDSLTSNNSIIAGNIAAGGNPDLKTGFTTNLNYSLIGDKSGTSLTEAPVGSPNASGSLIGGPVNGVINPLLGTLADNGGPTPTHALLTGSPAIDKGNPAIVFNPAEFDQRGAPFVRVFDGDGTGGARIDLGAFESQMDNNPPPLPGDYNLNNTVDAADYTLWRDMLGASVTPYSSADGDGNGVIDQNDYDVWKTNFGMTLESSSVSAIARLPNAAPRVVRSTDTTVTEDGDTSAMALSQLSFGFGFRSAPLRLPDDAHDRSTLTDHAGRFQHHAKGLLAMLSRSGRVEHPTDMDATTNRAASLSQCYAEDRNTLPDTIDAVFENFERPKASVVNLSN